MQNWTAKEDNLLKRKRKKEGKREKKYVRKEGQVQQGFDLLFEEGGIKNVR